MRNSMKQVTEKAIELIQEYARAYQNTKDAGMPTDSEKRKLFDVIGFAVDTGIIPTFEDGMKHVKCTITIHSNYEEKDIGVFEGNMATTVSQAMKEFAYEEKVKDNETWYCHWSGCYSKKEIVLVKEIHG